MRPSSLASCFRAWRISQPKITTVSCHLSSSQEPWCVTFPWCHLLSLLGLESYGILHSSMCTHAPHTTHTYIHIHHTTFIYTAHIPHTTYTHITHSPQTSTHYSYPVLYFIKLPHCDHSGLCFNVILTERPLLRLCKYAPICPSHYSPSLHCTLLLFLMSLIVVIDLCVICLPHEIPPFMG